MAARLGNLLNIVPKTITHGSLIGSRSRSYVIRRLSLSTLRTNLPFSHRVTLPSLWRSQSFKSTMCGLTTRRPLVKYLPISVFLWRPISTFCDKKGPIGDDVKDLKQQKPVDVEKELCRNKLKENVITVPNFLCLGRLLSAPFIAHLIMIGSHPTALAILFAAGLSDLFDGMIARRWPSQRSIFGTAFDPFADKILMTCVIVAEGAAGLLPVPLAALMIGRDIALLTGGFFYRYKSLGPPVTVSKYFDVTHGTTEFRPTFISKVNTALQLTLLGMSLLYPVCGWGSNALLIQSMWYLVAGTTCASGMSYIVGKDTVRLRKAKGTK